MLARSYRLQDKPVDLHPRVSSPRPVVVHSATENENRPVTAALKKHDERNRLR